MDIGTNSIRLMVVRLNANRSYTVIRQLKETVRLGEAEFAQHRLRPEAIDRAVAIVKQFAMLSRMAGASEIIAVATAATREAENRRVFLDRVSEEAGVEVHVVSGLEEARLIYLGVTSGVHLDNRLALCIDIGGGSTELAIGTHVQHLYLNSLKLGAIRLTNQFLTGDDGPVHPRLYQAICRFVRSEASRTVHELKAYPFDLALGSSGTIENLAEIASRVLRYRPIQKDEPLRLTDLKRVVAMLCDLSVEERRRVPGMNPTRADIIIGGAAILETLMDDLALGEIQVSERGLREGLLVDYLLKHGHSDLVEGGSLRERSVLQLGRSCHFNEEHACTTARLAEALFDTGIEAGLHKLGENERELLRYASLLHHIGSFLTHSNYHRHTHYLVRNAELLGFDQTEVAMIAATALFHRNVLPRRKDPEMEDLSQGQQDAVRVMSMLLRLAESLDRSQANVVKGARFVRLDSKRVLLHVEPSHGWEVELAAVDNQRKAFARTFERNLVIEAVPESIADAIAGG
jgi:exopolyphosphatase/guanosine-5'-triphosphate,3'-diphosphate pyrophosphatase